MKKATDLKLKVNQHSKRPFSWLSTLKLLAQFKHKTFTLHKPASFPALVKVIDPPTLHSSFLFLAINILKCCYTTLIQKPVRINHSPCHLTFLHRKHNK